MTVWVLWNNLDDGLVGVFGTEKEAMSAAYDLRRAHASLDKAAITENREPWYYSLIETELGKIHG